METMLYPASSLLLTRLWKTEWTSSPSLWVTPSFPTLKIILQLVLLERWRKVSLCLAQLETMALSCKHSKYCTLSDDCGSMYFGQSLPCQRWTRWWPNYSWTIILPASDTWCSWERYPIDRWYWCSLKQHHRGYSVPPWHLGSHSCKERIVVCERGINAREEKGALVLAVQVVLAWSSTTLLRKVTILQLTPISCQLHHVGAKAGAIFIAYMNGTFDPVGKFQFFGT